VHNNTSLELLALHIKAYITTKYSLLWVIISYKFGLAGSVELFSGVGGGADGGLSV